MLVQYCLHGAGDKRSVTSDNVTSAWGTKAIDVGCGGTLPRKRSLKQLKGGRQNQRDEILRGVVSRQTRRNGRGKGGTVHSTVHAVQGSNGRWAKEAGARRQRPGLEQNLGSIG